MKIAPDKWKHFFVGILMGVVLQGLGWWIFPRELIITSVITFTIIIGISYGFELFSKITGKGHYEILDAVASIIGGTLGMFAVLLFQLR